MPPDIKPTGIDKPSGANTPAAASSNEPVIHVIPEKFYGAGLKMKAPPLAAAPAPVVVPGAPGVPVPPGGAPKKPDTKKKIIIIAAGVIALIGVGVAAYFLAAPSEPPAPPAPVCGNNKCEAPSETSASCVADCPKPAPVCGDNKCEAPLETSASCSDDCGPPAPVCGDNKCVAPSETSVNCPVDCPLPKPVCGDNKCEAPEETTASCVADCKPPEPKPGVDSDSDGLSDQEEREVFGTEPSNPNSDRDSYVDLNEVLNLYDPAGPAPALLRNNLKIATYDNKDLGYSLLYPKAWIITNLPEVDASIEISAPGEESFTVEVRPKVAGQGIMDWYLAYDGSVTSSQVEPFKTRAGFDSIMSPDRMTAAVDLGDKIVLIKYELGGELLVEYRVTFQMVVQSLAKAK